MSFLSFSVVLWAGTINYAEFVSQITRKNFGEPRGDGVQNGAISAHFFVTFSGVFREFSCFL